MASDNNQETDHKTSQKLGKPVFYFKRTQEHRLELPGNYPYFENDGNLPLCLDNYALFSLPLIFTTSLYTYPLSNIIYLG